MEDMLLSKRPSSLDIRFGKIEGSLLYVMGRMLCNITVPIVGRVLDTKGFLI